MTKCTFHNSPRVVAQNVVVVVVVLVARGDQVCDNVINDVIDEHLHAVSTNHRPAPAPQCSDSHSVDEWLAELKMTR